MKSVVRHWNEPVMEVIKSASLEVFETLLCHQGFDSVDQVDGCTLITLKAFPNLDDSMIL